MIVMQKSNGLFSQDNMATEGGKCLRPVEFRGLSTHYVMGEDIHVFFRYRTSSFQPHSDDKIKLYVRGARLGRDRSIGSACVGDSSKHRLCDGGLYKTGTVTIATSTLSDLVTSQRSYLLLYGSGRLRQVVGKSAPFIICPQQEFPSIQIRSIEDNVYIEKLRSHSPIDNHATFPKGVGVANGEDMSFVMVSDSNGVLGDWESLEDEEEREGEDGESLNDSESWSDIGDNLEAISLSSSSSEVAESTESETENPPTRGGVPYHNALASASHYEGMDVEASQVGSSERPSINPLSPVSKPRRMNGTVEKAVKTVEGATTNEDLQTNNHRQDQSESKPGPLMDDVSGCDMAESVVIVEDMTQEKATLLKNSNKELRTKVRVLHDKLRSVTEERDTLHTTVGELQGKLSSIKRHNYELKQKNKKLTEKKTAIKSKCRQLERENAVLTRHCEKQLVQIRQYETQLSTVSRENGGLRRQLHHVAKKSKCNHQSSDQQHHQHCHEPQKMTGTMSAPAVTSSKRAPKTDKMSKAMQHGVFPQKPVIDIYVRDPPQKKDADKRGREATRSISGHQKRGKLECSASNHIPTVAHDQSDKEKGMHAYMYIKAHFSCFYVQMCIGSLPPYLTGGVIYYHHDDIIPFTDQAHPRLQSLAHSYLVMMGPRGKWCPV